MDTSIGQIINRSNQIVSTLDGHTSKFVEIDRFREKMLEELNENGEVINVIVEKTGLADIIQRNSKIEELNEMNEQMKKNQEERDRKHRELCELSQRIYEEKAAQIRREGEEFERRGREEMRRIDEKYESPYGTLAASKVDRGNLEREFAKNRIGTPEFWNKTWDDIRWFLFRDWFKHWKLKSVYILAGLVALSPVLNPLIHLLGWFTNLFVQSLINIREEVVPSETFIDKTRRDSLEYIDKNIVRLRTLNEVKPYMKTGLKLLFILGLGIPSILLIGYIISWTVWLLSLFYGIFKSMCTTIYDTLKGLVPRSNVGDIVSGGTGLGK